MARQIDWYRVWWAVIVLACILCIVNACAPVEKCGVLMPPPQFVHAPSVSFRIRYADWNHIPITCQQLGKEETIKDVQACARLMPVLGWVIVLPLIDGVKVTRFKQSCLEEHEMAHVNGWGDDHAGGVIARLRSWIKLA
jgi:hypothetical protein